MWVHACGYELKAVPPDRRLNVVGICPCGLEVVVGGVNDQVGVVADEAAAKVVAGVDGVSGYDVTLCGSSAS